MRTGDQDLAVFEEQRPRIFGLAYRMLGSATEAEDITQEVFLRWFGADRGALVSPPAWLTRVTTNLCLNQLSAARTRRERYVGPWLPEPVLTGDDVPGPPETAERRESVSMAVLVVLERLTPPERAAFVLREAFGHPHREIAEIIGVSEAASRQLHRRARARLAEERGRFGADADQHRRVVERFLTAATEGDVRGLEELLAEDVVSWSDGGGRTTAARRPVVGRESVLRYVLGLAGHRDAALLHTRFAEVNGQLGVLLLRGDDLVAVLSPDTDGQRITTLRVVVNPEKLRFVASQLA
ncbi:RNA polymerase sigma-70 factor [Actinoalloteichus sp. AHMU CJ021]|uniref:RNA polymerase sigma-70 factor n=1 Tax=Actinoalloteichus TaxID=65496 RepID=UPI00041DCB47|nr:RNA polymerase sigma-70 factor [Actinoalloteichus caeruleus]AUS78825.1 RNA polymerase sigma-70 factor [Actinoalloteichus sp. AHMU CJ021]